jgi:branched-chain amino acid transport system permease protein
MTALSLYATQALHGLVYGMLLFLIASGLTLVFGLMRIMNIAHAAFYMIGAYLAYEVTRLTGSFWASVIIVPVLAGLGGGLVERFLLRRTFSLGHAYQLLLTFGLFYMAQEAVLWIWDSYALDVPMATSLRGTVPVFGSPYPIYRLFIAGLSGVVTVAMFATLYLTRVGTIIRCVVADGQMAQALGLNVSLIRFSVFATGAALAALAGVIAAPFVQADPTMGDNALLDGFVVVILGGFGSLSGALIASVIVGQMQSFGVMFLPELTSSLEFMLMVAVLSVRPAGLFGDRS